MELKKLAPWNWFKDEEESSGQSRNVPVSRTAPQLYTPIARFHDEIDRMFDNVFRNFGLPSLGLDSTLAGLGQNMMLRPNVDISATDKEYTVTVEVPGVDEKDVKLELVGDTLTIKGEKKQESEKKEKDFYRVERSYGSFQRVLTLPEDADQEGINAQFKNGVLSITLPRRAVSKPKGKVIDIKKAA